MEGLLFPEDRSIANDTLQQALLLDMQEDMTDRNGQDDSDSDDEEQDLSSSPQVIEQQQGDPHAARHVLLTVAIAGSALALALVVPNISVVFGLLGGSASSILGFVLPGCLGVKMQQRHVWKAWILLVGGIIVAVVTTSVTIYTTLFPTGPSSYPNPCHDDDTNSTLVAF
jgi:hypothetical protein